MIGASRRRLRGCLLLLAAVLAMGAGPPPRPARPTSPPGVVTEPPGVVIPFPVPAPSYCWVSVRLFETLRYGTFEFCRRKLRYTPGSLECFQITDQVCATRQADGTWSEARTPVLRQALPCPAGPEPPVCRRMDFW